MTWQRMNIRLACGCESGATWDDVEAGDEEECMLHGITTVQRKSRIMDAKGSRNYQLGHVDEEATKNDNVGS